MPKPHNAIDRANEMLRGLRNIVGMSEGGVERFGETLTPVLDAWRLPEHRVPRGEYPWTIRYPVAAGAGVYSTFEVGAVDNTWLVMVDAVYPTSIVNLRWHSAPAVGAVGNEACRSRDSRHGFLDFLQMYHGTTASAPNASMMRLVPNIWNPVEIVLSKQYLLQIRGEAVNTAIDICAVGRVRQVYPGELEA